MSGVGDFLFGSKPKQAKAKDLTPDEFKGLRSPVAGGLRNIIASGGLPQFSGNMAAELTGAESDILAGLTDLLGTSATGTAENTLGELAGGRQNPFAGAVGLSPAEMAGLADVGGAAFGNTDLTSASRDLLMRTLAGDFTSPDSNPFLAGAIEAATRPILENFGDEQSALRGQFSAAGQSTGRGASSPFEAALARLATGTANAVGDVGAELSFANMESERGRMMQALGLAEQIPGMDLNRMLAGMDALALPREVAQGGADRAAAAFESDQARRLDAANAIPQFNRGQIEDTLSVLEAQALPRLIEQLGIDRGLAEFQRQQQTLLQALTGAGQLASPTAAVIPGTSGQTGFVQSFMAGGGPFNFGGGGATT